MKKLLSFMMVLVFASTIFAQNVPTSFKIDEPITQSRSNEYVCATGSVFSQFEADGESFWYCQEGYAYNQVGEDYIASAPFSTMRFWGADIGGCTLAANESFDIYIYDGNPSTTGMIVNSFTLDGATTFITTMGVENVYQIDINFGETITQLNGWIVISRNNPTCAADFGWLGVNGGNSISGLDGGGWLSNSGKLFFCLGNSASIPISNWALGIGLLLISGFIVVRFRRRLA